MSVDGGKEAGLFVEDLNAEHTDNRILPTQANSRQADVDLMNPITADRATLATPLEGSIHE